MRRWNSGRCICYRCVNISILHSVFQMTEQKLSRLETTRFTNEQRETINQIINFLGEDSLNNMIAVFSKCRKAPTINPDQLLNSFSQEEKDFLDRIGNRFTISPNLEIFDEPNDLIVARHMTNLKNYIVSFSDCYTAAIFKKVGENEYQRNVQMLG
ncbi:14457_t:CDS:1 [Funneliformis caledonium]|uniref:14457_t:CDS:1 n=1 Tax=Funneliformis caledonium TaxID=1117310 RepID=A0A9N9G664_9GLOM|nr:14457_t:CDS:1 [Funneliformis caledonium]